MTIYQVNAKRRVNNINTMDDDDDES